MFRNDFGKLKNDKSYRQSKMRSNDILLFISLNISILFVGYSVFLGEFKMIIIAFVTFTIMYCGIACSTPIKMLANLKSSYLSGFKALFSTRE
jgi:hypothetical protein